MEHHFDTLTYKQKGNIIKLRVNNGPKRIEDIKHK